MRQYKKLDHCILLSLISKTMFILLKRNSFYSNSEKLEHKLDRASFMCHQKAKKRCVLRNELPFCEIFSLRCRALDRVIDVTGQGVPIEYLKWINFSADLLSRGLMHLRYFNILFVQLFLKRFSRGFIFALINFRENQSKRK